MISFAEKWAKKLKYIIGYKFIYLIFLLLNIIKSSMFIIISGPFILVHGFILFKIFYKKVGPIIINVDRVLSIGRMIIITLVSTGYGIGFAQGSPVLWVIWMPIIDSSQYLRGYIGILALPILCLLLLSLEVYYFILLNRNKDELRKNLPPK